jgi:hypothetical protein
MTPEAVNQVCEAGFQMTGVDARLLKSFFLAETSYDPSRVSPVGAMGGFQLMPDALAELYRRGITITNPFDPMQSVRGGGEWLKYNAEKCQQRSVKIGSGKQARYVMEPRTYVFQNRTWSFKELPNDIQIMILAHVYNAGPENVFGNASTPKGYDVSVIINHEYSRKVVNAYREMH